MINTNDPATHSSNTSKCPSDELLAQFVEGTLVGPDLAQVLNHIDSCEPCFDLAAMAMEVSDAELQPLTHPTLSKKKWRRWHALAATAIIPAAAVLLILFNPLLFFDRDGALLRATQSTQIAFVDLAQKGVEPELFLLDLNIDILEVRRNFDAKRGTSEPSNESANANLAIVELEKFLKKAPSEVQAYEQLIALHLFSKNYASAVDVSRRLLNISNSPKTQAYWNLSNFYYNRGQDSQWLDTMAQLYKDHPNNRFVVFNYARMLGSSNSDPQIQAQVWNHYHHLDPDSPFGDVAKGYMELSPNKEGKN